MPVQNLIPVILGITIARLAWIIYFFVRIAVNTKQEGAVFPSWIISVKNAGKFTKCFACLPQAGALRIAMVCYGKGP